MGDLKRINSDEGKVRKTSCWPPIPLPSLAATKRALGALEPAPATQGPPHPQKRALGAATGLESMREATAAMVEGYRDGLDLTSPEPSSNRTASYRHGFWNGRDDRSGRPRASYQRLLEMAQEAEDADAIDY